ncbi:MAG: amino acid ABC transporter permease [Sebaldella sp.]|nr:amino acid ABC transporter permease [Sebaldella sp.]
MSELSIFLQILSSLPNVLIIYFVTAIFSLPLGILGALAYTSDSNIFKKVISFFTWIFRGTPLLLQLFFIYYGLPILTNNVIVLDRMPAALVTFIINYTAYLVEIVRSGLESIDKGQSEAAKVLGYTYSQKIRYIILPQAIRRVLPSLGNEAITLLKDTALIYILSLTEILKATKEIANRYSIITPYLYAGIIYLGLSFLIDKIFKNIEKRNKVRV